MVSRMEMQQLAEKYGEEARGTDSAAGGARGALTPAAGTWDQSGTPAPADWGSSSEARVAGEKKAAPRLVPFTVTVTLALPLPPVKESNNKKDHKPKTLKILEALKALDYFHVEVSLLPNAEPTIFDLVIFEKAAKLHMANDSQILRLWNENERRWLVFSHNVMLPVTNELLLTLVPHIMTLRIWEGKDKVSPKAKFDHPKNLHHQLEKEGASLGGVRCLVNEQLQLLENSPLLTTSKATDNLPPESINIPVQGTFSTLGLPDIERTMDEQLPGKTCAKPNKPIKIQGAKKHLSVQISKKGSSHKVRADFLAETSKMQDKDKIVSPKMPQNKKKIKEIPVPGLINLDMRFLLAGDKTVTNKLEKLMPGILDAIFTVSMDKSLMSEEMARELNPMIIRITSASSMPSTPIPIHVLQQKCGPVYCQYQFHDLPCHQTKGREQGTEISFKDVNVILTGTINPDKLKEYFLGPPLTIEIHDRDRKLKAQLQPPALFGLKNKGLKVLWEKLPVRSVPDEKEKVKVLYNSDFSFHQRLYGKLDDKLYHIYLHEPLSNILKQPLLYVRDMTPQGCFQALHRLQYLCSVEKLREVVQGDLFPTAAMIMVLSREFGIPASESDPRIVKDSPTIPTSLISETPAGKKPSRIPLDIYNKDYMQSKQDRIILTNHIQNNIDAVYEASRKLKETEPRSIKVVLPEGRKVHNYSIQTFNSTEEAKRLLWEMLAKKPKQRFTYSQKFLAGIVTSVDVVSEEKRMKKKSKEAWLTSDGFRFPGFKSSLEANEHPKKPDQARIDELKKPWKENILHGNLNAPLKHQGRWKWNERHKDFELYKQVRYGSSPISILLAGDTLRFEQLESIQKDYKDWYKKMKSYRNTSHSELSITKLENKTKPDKWVTGCLKPTICQKHSDFQHPKD
ncbi:uncharacterized protein cfap92 isoform X3 [Narcine bancroftii]|uniref:uncharacterized protein cfap92 isoform X3 n=1 Tax=Narcine bancroftii TaxID=1343680 RepID=UPI0038318697